MFIKRQLKIFYVLRHIFLLKYLFYNMFLTYLCSEVFFIGIGNLVN
jgi:hypothetical protein